MLQREVEEHSREHELDHTPHNGKTEQVVKISPDDLYQI